MVLEEARVAAGLSLQTRRALLEQMAPEYHEAPPPKKRLLLDAFTRTTGYHRTYAQWLLNHSEKVLQTIPGIRANRAMGQTSWTRSCRHGTPTTASVANV